MHKKKGKVYYCDTDCVITDVYINPEEEKDMMHETELGKWSEEVHCLDGGYFISPKQYMMKQIVVDKKATL